MPAIAAAFGAPLRHGKRLLRSAVDLVMPPVCPGCRTLLGSPAGLCFTCWQKVRFLERPWCERLGTPLSLDLGPGVLSAEAIANPPRYARARSAVVYDGLVPDLVQAFKYSDRLDLAPMFAAWMLRVAGELLDETDLILPVPLHWTRLARRRFNQAGVLAGLVGRRAGRSVRHDILLRVKRTRQQVGLGRTDRSDNLRGAFLVPQRKRGAIAGKAVLLIDDVLTTGATLDAAVGVLLRAGARTVNVLTLARVIDPG
ncbi:ComF family protein [Oryzibacter oryziterrae]|uniref:ComF family protein n=1 Tax=Oryzibacter oryziterrae TaxID=2766474 RepID=UPI001F450E72|nr:ComF family protein [Oryzibacter oryziterrae]